MAIRAWASPSASLRSVMSRMMTWKAGLPPQLVRALATSTGVTSPSTRCSLASNPFTTSPGPRSSARRAMVLARSSAWMNEAIGAPRPSFGVR